MTASLELRRAKIGDVAAITSFVRTATRSRIPADEAEVTEWLFGKGLWVAVRGSTLVGVAAWQAENLVSVTDLFCVSPEQELEEVGSRLLQTIEAEANRLICEINVLLLPAWASTTARTFLRQQGYESWALPDLHRIWREVLADFATEGRDLMVKQLRDRMVMVPV